MNEEIDFHEIWKYPVGAHNVHPGLGVNIKFRIAIRLLFGLVRIRLI